MKTITEIITNMEEKIYKLSTELPNNPVIDGSFFRFNISR